MVCVLSSTEHTVPLSQSCVFCRIGRREPNSYGYSAAVPISGSTHLPMSLAYSWRGRREDWGRRCPACAWEERTADKFDRFCAENTESHLKCGRAETQSGGTTVESGRVGIAVCVLREAVIKEWMEEVKCLRSSKTGRESDSPGRTVWPIVFREHLC